MMFVLAGSAALRESVTIDEVAHIGAGLSCVQKLDLRFNAMFAGGVAASALPAWRSLRVDPAVVLRAE
jgi:hypothetical protein